CSRLIGNRTAVINQLRGFLLEHGIPVRQGLRFLRQQLPQILAMRTDVLSPRMIRIIEELIGDWEHLDERIERVTDEIETLARADENCRRLMTVPHPPRAENAANFFRWVANAPFEQGAVADRGGKKAGPR